MGLATEEEWETDPELRQMRREFVESFAARRQALEATIPALGRGKPGDEGFERALKESVFVAHKLGGAAETYGFPTLTRACAALEDWHTLTEPSKRSAAEAIRFSELLAAMLAGAQALGKDAREFEGDPRFVELQEAARGGAVPRRGGADPGDAL